MPTWEKLGSGLWNAKGVIDDAVLAISPDMDDKDTHLTRAESTATLCLRAMQVTLSQASKPTTEQIIEVTDKALIDMRSMKKPTERVIEAIGLMETARKQFVALASDPSDYEDAEEESEGEAEAK